MTRVFLVEDHAGFRQALAVVIGMQPDMAVAGEAGSLRAAIGMLPDARADVYLVDLHLPDGSGVDLVRAVHARGDARTVVLTGSAARGEWAHAVEAGAAGVISKAADMEEILDALRRAADGEVLLSAGELVDLVRLASRERRRDEAARARAARLTPREREVLQLLAEGLSNKEISARLHVAVDTQRTHVTNILAKLEVHSQLQAIVFAIRQGLVSVESPTP